MVQKYQSPVRVYKYPFELVMKAYERRFPSCPQIPVVVNCEVISNWTSPDTSINKTERRCKLRVDAPYILKKIIGVDHVYFVQTNVLNLRTRTLEIEAYNESFQNRVVVLETCRYFVHPENSDWTCFEQSAEVDIHSFLGFENTIEKLAMKQYAANIAKGKEIIEHFMAELKAEGITHVEIWQRPPNSPPAEDEENNEDDSNKKIENVNICSKPRKNSGQQSSIECQFQLETDYIQRYLGQLTPMQESRLVQFRQSVANLQKGKIPGDTTLLRFLRARDFNVEKARTMISESLMWRKTHGVDKVLSDYVTPQVVKDYFPGGWHHHDKDGLPVYLLRLGHMDVKGLLKSIGPDGLLKLTMHICEEGLRLTEEATMSNGKPISTWCLLVDLDGLNMRHLWRPGVKALLRIIEIVEANYPETLGRVLIIRAPRVFPILWTIVSAFIDEMTRTKFLFYGGNDYQEPGGLVDYIPHDFVPDFLGGPCKTKVHEGGLIPKSMYLTDSELDHMVEDSIYQSVAISKGQVHEVKIPVEDPGSVITWDFDVMKQDVSFSVIHSQFKDGSEIGEDVKTLKVELSQICQDGESMQGSHVASIRGMYTLQWNYHSSPTHHHHHHNPAKIIYYYEVLKSADYKGSMSSLQSGNSSFSALSSGPPMSR